MNGNRMVISIVQLDTKSLLSPPLLSILPLYMAVAEIVKASKREACLLPTQAELFARDVKSIISISEDTTQDTKNEVTLSKKDNRNEEKERVLKQTQPNTSAKRVRR
ncbi:hypothetical protein GmHk_15G043847 [Glycine max]|nr:hypothetical protein GmHk_15G043847 [Glycine max]